MAEDLRQFEEKVEKLEQKIGQLENDLRNAKGNVRALSVIIGLMADKYPDNLAGMYIRECVKFGLAGDLMKKEISGLRYLARIMERDTLEKLVALCTEQAVQEEEEPREFEMPDVPSAQADGSAETGGAAEKRQLSEERNPAAEAETDQAAKTERAAAGKRAAAKTRKKSTGAADGL